MKYEITGIHDNGGVTRAYLILECAKRCSLPIRQGEPKKWDSGHIWGWDGKTEKPTVLPSINCSQCGFHKTLREGEWK